MNPATYLRPADAAEGLQRHEALAALAPSPLDAAKAEPDDPLHAPLSSLLRPIQWIAGGTNLLDLMKEGVARPTHLIDASRLPFDEIALTPTGSLRIGATAKNADTAYHPLVKAHHPLLSDAILAGASPQIRNMATNGGNALQRTRCVYFYDVALPCNKRRPGSGCSAIGGWTRQHAVLGASEHCIAVHPSDLCVALAALGAVVHLTGPHSERSMPFLDFHRLPGQTPHLETNLRVGELITGFEIPAAPEAPGAIGHAYLKLRDRASYAFALVSVAARLTLTAEGQVDRAQVALGGVAHKPWRRPEAEAELVGQRAERASFEHLALRLLEGAQGQGDNGFKIDLARRAIVRALEAARDSAARGTPL